MNAPQARVPAQAKLNLHLRVLAREAEGHHQLETLFCRVALADDVLVRVRAAKRSLDVRGADTGAVERNLAWRAALAYQEAAGWPAGFAIEIGKRIPVGAGLGGGSADAGAVLRALDALAPRPMGEAALLRIATSLGADVPFMTIVAPLALAWGRGERMLTLPALPERDVALVTPSFAVATADAYRWLDESRTAFAPQSAILGREQLASWEGLASLATNDFERVVAARHPEIGAITAALRQSGARIARLTGSGSTVFAVFDTPPAQALDATLGGTVRWTRTSLRVEPVAFAE